MQKEAALSRLRSFPITKRQGTIRLHLQRTPVTPDGTKGLQENNGCKSTGGLAAGRSTGDRRIGTFIHGQALRAKGTASGGTSEVIVEWYSLT